MPRGEIVLELSEAWGVVIGTIDYYIMQVRAEWREIGSQDREFHFENVRGTFEQIAREARAAGDYNASNAAMREVSKMLGFGNDKLDINQRVLNVNVNASALPLEEKTRYIDSASNLLSLTKRLDDKSTIPVAETPLGDDGDGGSGSN